MKLVTFFSFFLAASVHAGEPPTTKGIIDPAKTERPEDAVVLVGEEGYDLVPDGVGKPLFPMRSNSPSQPGRKV